MTAPLDINRFVAASKPIYDRCRMGVLLEGMKPSERAQVNAALAADRRLVTSAGIAKVLCEAGHKITAHTVRRHRRGECQCNG